MRKLLRADLFCLRRSRVLWLCMAAAHSSSVPAGAANQPNLITPITTLAAHASRMAKQPITAVIR